MSYQHLPDNPPTTLSSQDYYVHRTLIYQRMNNIITVDKPTGNAVSDTANIRDAITAAVAVSGGNGGIVVFGAGAYAVNSTIEIRGVRGLHLLGNGKRTVIQWSGATDAPVLKLAKSREMLIADIDINCGSGAYAGIQCLRDSGTGTTPRKNQFQRVGIFGTAQSSFIFGGVGAVDANNDFMHLVDCLAQGYTYAGYAITHSQAYNYIFDNCEALGTGQYGLDAGGVGASIWWRGGGCSSHSSADYRLGRSYQPHIIEFANCENSARFLVTANNSYSQITLRSCRWAGNLLHEDNDAIVTLGANQLLIEQCSIGDGASPTNATTINLSVNTLCEIKMCRIYSSAEDVWSGKTPDAISLSHKITDEQTLATETLT